MIKADGNKALKLRIAELKETTDLEWEEIATLISDEFGKKHTGESVRARYKRIKKGTKPPKLNRGVLDRAATLIQTEKRNPEDVTSDEWLDALESAQSIRGKVSIRESLTAKEIKTDRPIAIVFTSDWHIGSGYVNYGALREDKNIIRDDPRIFACLGGDPTDNFPQSFRDASAPANALSPPMIQKLTFETIMIELEPSIIAMIGGNHNKMDMKKSGMDTDYFILRGRKFSYLPQGGKINLTVGKVKYGILWKHHYRFNSALNKFNSHHRMLELLSPDVDIVVTEHEHSPGIESIERGEFDQKKTVVNIRTGSYKEQDPYSMEYFQAGRRGPQTVILWPDKRKVLAMHGADGLRDAQVYLDGWYGKKEKG